MQKTGFTLADVNSILGKVQIMYMVNKIGPIALDQDELDMMLHTLMGAMLDFRTLTANIEELTAENTRLASELAKLATAATITSAMQATSDPTTKQG